MVEQRERESMRLRKKVVGEGIAKNPEGFTQGLSLRCCTVKK